MKQINYVLLLGILFFGFAAHASVSDQEINDAQEYFTDFFGDPGAIEEIYDEVVDEFDLTDDATDQRVYDEVYVEAWEEIREDDEVRDILRDYSRIISRRYDLYNDHVQDIVFDVYGYQEEEELGLVVDFIYAEPLEQNNDRRWQIQIHYTNGIVDSFSVSGAEDEQDLIQEAARYLEWEIDEVTDIFSRDYSVWKEEDSAETSEDAEQNTEEVVQDEDNEKDEEVDQEELIQILILLIIAAIAESGADIDISTLQ